MAGQTDRKPRGDNAGTPKDGDGISVEVRQMTPMMAQYTEIKAANPDCLLFYRMGDFYELFFEDALVASQALGITLTKRGKHLGEDVAMCGVPIHSADGYLQRLIRLGHRVAVCEQTEDPAEAKKRGSKAVVRRDVVRLVTPGTLTEDSLLDARTNNFLCALFGMPSRSDDGVRDYAVASIDISTGEFFVGQVAAADLIGELVRLCPREIVTDDLLVSSEHVRLVSEQTGAALTPVPLAYFDSLAGERSLKAAFGVMEIDGFGAFERGELAAIAGVLKYVDLTQIGKMPALRPPRKSGPQSMLVIDGATRVSLELTRTSGGNKKGSLLSTIDRTVTGPGARVLASRLASPLNDPKAIDMRLDGVRFFYDRGALRDKVRGFLKGVPDLARAYSRLRLGRGGPRDLGALKEGLGAARDIADCFAQAADVIDMPGVLHEAVIALTKPDAGFCAKLRCALGDDLPVHRRDGGFVREGFREDLDESRLLRDKGREVLAALQAKYAEATAVKSLKVRHNNVLGYFVEVTALHGKSLMEGAHGDVFIHRQTLANAIRFTTAELSEAEAKIIRAGERALAIEQEVFGELVSDAAQFEEAIASVAAALGEIDHYAALGLLADEENYVRPEIHDGDGLAIEGGRHPVVEQAHSRASDGPFIENDCCLGGSGGEGVDAVSKPRILIVTGPNMAGKSTYLRQNALIVILAQMGSFVPASSAHIGVVDRLFSRVGASDDLARGRSTFMVEMVEAANILNQAGPRSLVILDEIGRGTATYDGLSIAWATVEYLHEVNCCRTLFATHYHELTALAQQLDYAANATIEVKDWKDEIVFLHKVIPGAADRSYGIQVAKLAGLPQNVIMRAAEVLQLLEQSGDKTSANNLIDDLPLFAAMRPKSLISTRKEPGLVDKALEEMNLDNMTPREALEALYRLKALGGDDV